MKETHSLFIASSGAFMICIILRFEKKEISLCSCYESFVFKEEKIIEGV